MAESTIESIHRHLQAELQSGEVTQLPRDFYSRISEYSQTLRRSAGSGSSEVIERLISRQAEMIRGMAKELLEVREKKAFAHDAYAKLLPEERYVFHPQMKFKGRFEAFVEALANGQPSFIQMANRKESTRSLTVRFTKHVDELVGLDLRHYGPFETEDLASIPAADAAVLIAAGDAVEIVTRDET